ncbi:hypothetical protein [Bradyrhizobium altum]|uniref:hypothetical protein n=1 Tax=Bradyrhizobium altum TaxID=1571202 RepID=UPI001E4789B7|nr:hypothetical protein [Bradyrhizobium altum]
MVDLIQQRVLPAISSSLEISPITILKAEGGMAPVPTIKSGTRELWLESLNHRRRLANRRLSCRAANAHRRRTEVGY